MHGGGIFVPVLIGLSLLAAPQGAGAESRFAPQFLDMNRTTLADLAARLPTMEYAPGDTGILVYGTGRGFVYRYQVLGERIGREIKTNLWKGIKTVDLADLNGDGEPEILALTKEAMLYALDLNSLEIVWKTEEGYFEGISCFTVADMENDGKPEIIILADQHLFVFDIGSGSERWKSLNTYEATHIVAGDVDADGKKELVLSDGTVLDSRLYQEEWIYELSFGPTMDLVDLDGDGVLEVVSLDGAGDLQIVHVDDRAREFK
jgi:outer membrane protein assembly factor BamB